MYQKIRCPQSSLNVLIVFVSIQNHFYSNDDHMDNVCYPSLNSKAPELKGENQVLSTIPILSKTSCSKEELSTCVVRLGLCTKNLIALSSGKEDVCFFMETLRS